MSQMKQILSQQMKLTPQQVLLSSLLQLPITALEQRLKQELEQNPLLEESEELEEILEEEEELLLKQEKEDEKEIPEEKIIEQEKEKEASDESEVDWQKILNDDQQYQPKTPRGQGEDDEQEWIQPNRISLTDMLLEQLRWAPLSEAEKEIGEYLIYSLNDDGYLMFEEGPEVSDLQTFSEAAANFESAGIEELPPLPKSRKQAAFIDPLPPIAERVQSEVSQIEKVLKVIQTFEPAGIASRTLRECITIQLERLDETANYYELTTRLCLRIIHESYEDFINRRYEKVSKQLQITMDDIKSALAIILKLNPKPGEGFIQQEQNYITPDATVKKINDKYEIVLNNGDIPNLRINNMYRQLLLSKNSKEKDTKEFVKNKLEAAKWLINSLYRRRDTIFRTISTLVELQKEFFDKGPAHIKPMKLEDIATRINMDISTISRATNGKYIQTEFGVYELKYFFSAAMTNSDGEDISTRQLKAALKKIIDEENKKDPLSDEELAKRMTDNGNPVARRTVTKYREMLSIPVGRLRKEI